jgi:hypothetical protein
MAVCGGKPKKMRTGMVRRLVPPTRVPKEAPMMLVKKMIDRPEKFMMGHGAPRASPWSPTNIPTYAKASVGHPPVGEIRRSTAGMSV